MTQAPAQPARAYLHVGTHKTGTTSIQSFLALNESTLRRFGLAVPSAGRTERDFAAHHNVAWELLGDARFSPESGTLADLLSELREHAHPSICVSSEEFEFFVHHPDRLRPLVDGLAMAGYDLHVILYLRPQAEYLESLYAHALRAGSPLPFADELLALRSSTRVGDLQLDYVKLAGAFTHLVGAARVHLRTYDASARNDPLLRDFLRIVAPAADADFASLTRPQRLNVNVGRSASGQRAPRRFEPLTLRQIVSVSRRFFGSNLRLRMLYGVTIWPVSLRRLRHAVARSIRYRLRRSDVG